MSTSPHPADAGNRPFFSVVMPTFRRPDALREAVGAVLGQEYPGDRYELIVVDDEGEGAAAALISELDTGGLSVAVESQRRRGAATARNCGARRARGEVLLFLDDDIIVASDHLRRHANTLPADRRTLVNGAWEFTPATIETLRRTPFGRFRIELERHFQEEALGLHLRDGIVAMPMLGSWDLAVDRELFWELGGFDEQFPVAGAEDQDFSMRAREAGCVLWLDTKVVCLHNDDRLDLASYCAREERSAQTMPIIARKFPAEFLDTAYITENRPIRRNDPLPLIAKKAMKAILAKPAALYALHQGVRAAERYNVREPMLRGMYRILLGLHLYRGFRKTWRS